MTNTKNNPWFLTIMLKITSVIIISTKILLILIIMPLLLSISLVICFRSKNLYNNSNLDNQVKESSDNIEGRWVWEDVVGMNNNNMGRVIYVVLLIRIGRLHRYEFSYSNNKFFLSLFIIFKNYILTYFFLHWVEWYFHSYLIFYY